MFFKKPKRSTQPMPPWLKLGVIAFIIAAFGMHAAGVRPPNQGTSGSQQDINWGLPSLETYKTRLIPGYGQLQIKEVSPGKGTPTICGQDVKIRYREVSVTPTSPVKKADVKPVTETQTASFRLGTHDKEAPPSLQESVIGMQAGGKREVLVPSERAGPGKGALRYDIELLEATPTLPETDPHSLPLRIFDRASGIARPVRCGDTVKAHLKIWDMGGRVLLDTHVDKGQPFELQVGSGGLMLGLEAGLLGMLSDGSRTLIIPPALQKPLHGSEKAEKEAEKEQKSAGSAPDVLGKLDLPENQAILVDIDLVR